MVDYKKKADTMWAKYIRSFGRCERCGKGQGLQAAHIYSRRYMRIRHDLENGLCLCVGCHFWAHHNPVDFTDWVRGYLDDDILGRLKEKRDNLSVKPDYKAVYEELKSLVDRL